MFTSMLAVTTAMIPIQVVIEERTRAVEATSRIPPSIVDRVAKPIRPKMAEKPITLTAVVAKSRMHVRNIVTKLSTLQRNFMGFVLNGKDASEAAASH